jgi:hypothetical protein
MANQPSIRFMTANDVVWNGYRDSAQLVVYVDGKRIRCRVSPDCIDPRRRARTSRQSPNG